MYVSYGEFGDIYETNSILVTFIKMRQTVTKMATGCLRMVKMDIFVLNF